MKDLLLKDTWITKGEQQLKKILEDPNKKVYRLKNGDLKVYSPNGKGASFKEDGIFKGFIESQYE